jgi:toxin YoeB
MSNYSLRFSNQAKEDILFHKKSGNRAIINKITLLLNEIVLNPYKGTGKPEQLKFDLNGCWSRRINLEHRLVYKIEENFILILSLKGHY